MKITKEYFIEKGFISQSNHTITFEYEERGYELRKKEEYTHIIHHKKQGDILYIHLMWNVWSKRWIPNISLLAHGKTEEEAWSRAINEREIECSEVSYQVEP